MKQTKKKIKIFATAFDYRPRLGGVATLSYNLLRALQRMPDVEIILITPDLPGGKEFDSGSGIPTRRVWLPKAAAAATPKLVLNLPRLLLKHRPDVILHLLWHPSAIASYLNAPIRALLGIRYFIFAHGVEILESDRNWKKKLRGRLATIKRAVFGGAAGVFANSGFTGELVKKECRVPPDRIHVVHCGVDPEEFRPMPPAADLIEKHALAGKKVLLTFSRLEDYKGVDRGIAAMRRVLNKHPDALYLVCGEGADRPRLQALARHYGVAESVRFAGAVPFDRLRDYYNLCQVHLLLSRTDWEAPNVEGFGLVFLEAAACAKPSIGGRSGGISEVILHGQTGWLVDPHDDREISDVIIAALDDPKRTANLGLQAQERAVLKFTWNHMAEKVISEIRKKTRHVRN